MKKILVVDDDPDIIFITQYLLESKGYKVFTDNTGEKVHDIVEASQPDLVLLDIKLPHKDGIAICKELKAYSPIPVILFSAHAKITDTLQASMADDFIPKPFDVEHFEQTIEKYI